MGGKVSQYSGTSQCTPGASLVAGSEEDEQYDILDVTRELCKRTLLSSTSLHRCTVVVHLVADLLPCSLSKTNTHHVRYFVEKNQTAFAWYDTFTCIH